MKTTKILASLAISAAMLCPMSVQAKTIIAINAAGTKGYTNVESAWKAAQSGTGIILKTDWNLDERLVLDSDQTATIEMNGFKISRNLSDSERNGEVFKLCSNSTLNLNGKNASETTFTFSGYKYEQNQSEQTITSGGLVTGGNSTNGAGAVHMKQGSRLNLDSVAIAGNKAEENWAGQNGYGGAIYMDGDHDYLYMKNAYISYNWSEDDGGAVYINDNDSKIEMENSSISFNTARGEKSGDSDDGNGGAVYINDENVDIIMNGGNIDGNFSHGYGGGICSYADYTDVTMTNGASISNNTAYNNGGAIYFNYSKFTVESSDCTAVMNKNSANQTGADGADGGGAIALARCYLIENYGRIYGVTFSENDSCDGGALYIRQENITIDHCTVTKNTGEICAGIEITNDDCILRDTTVTENQGGAGVYVDMYNDITLEGQIMITSNKNTDGQDRDLVLTANAPKSYILSTPSEGSRIGIYAYESPRVFAKNQSASAQNVYFSDDPENFSPTYEEEDSEMRMASTDEVGIDLVDPTMYSATLNVTDNADFSDSSKTSVEENGSCALEAPTVAGKEFVEWTNVPDDATVDGNTVYIESVTEDVEVTAVYKDAETEETEETEASTTGSMFGNGTVIGAGVIVAILAGVAGFFLGKKKYNKE